MRKDDVAERRQSGRRRQQRRLRRRGRPAAGGAGGGAGAETVANDDVYDDDDGDRHASIIRGTNTYDDASFSHHPATRATTMEIVVSTTLSRRSALLSAAAVTAATTVTSRAAIAAEMMAGVTDTSLPQSLASLMMKSGGGGGGNSDIYYPRVFEGVWDVVSVLTEVVDNESGSGSGKAVAQAKQMQNAAVSYQARFFRLNSDVGRGDAAGRDVIICDREFTTRSLLEATLGDGKVLSSTWNPNSPRSLKMSLSGGIGDVENRVLASTTQSGMQHFESRELSTQIVTTDAAGSAVPASVKNVAVLPSVCLSKYKWTDDKTIDAVQRVAVYPDPLKAADEGTLQLESVLKQLGSSSTASSEVPTTVYKYSLRLTRREL